MNYEIRRFLIQLVDPHTFHHDLLATRNIRMTAGVIGIDLMGIRAGAEAVNVYPLLRFTND